MALTKIQIVESIRNQTGFPKNRSSQIVESLMFSGFGKFCVREKAERKGRNPATGDDMRLRPRRVVTFRCSRKLRDRVNG